MIFPFFKKICFLGILGPFSYGIGANIRIGWEILCLPYARFLNRILKYIRKVRKITGFQRNGSKFPKICFSWYVLAFYSIRAVTTLTMVDYGSPRLRITKKGWLRKNTKKGPTKYRGDMSGHLVPALWECMSADSWNSGLALSVGIRSEALTV